VEGQKKELRDIYAQMMDSNRISSWNPNGSVICNENDYQGVPIISKENDSSFVIAWWDDRLGIDLNIFIQKVNKSGHIQWKANGTSVVNVSNDQYEQELLCNSINDVFVIWEDKRIDGAGDIYMQKLNSSGLNQWMVNGTVVSNYTGGESNPKIISSDNSIFSSWGDAASNPRKISLMKYDINGEKNWTNPIAIVNGSQGLNLYNLISDNSGGVIVTWLDRRDDANGDLYLLRLDGDGNIWTPSDNGDGTLLMIGGLSCSPSRWASRYLRQ